MANFRQVPGQPLVLLLILVVCSYLYGVGTGICAGLSCWLVYRLFQLVYGALTEISWRRAGEELGLNYEGSEPDELTTTEQVADVLGEPLGPYKQFVAPFHPRYRLDGSVDGHQVEVSVCVREASISTIWSVDGPDALPDWLMVRPSSLPASADQWLDIEDIKVGDEQFDSEMIVAGPDTEAVRQFFWTHDFAKVLLELTEQYGPFEIHDGQLRRVWSGVVRRSKPICNELEDLLRVTNELESSLAEFGKLRADAEEGSQTKPSSEAAHVYE